MSTTNIIQEVEGISALLEGYQNQLKQLPPDQLVLFYEAVAASSKDNWRLQAAIITEYHARASNAGDAIQEITKEFGLSKSQIYSDIQVHKTFFEHSEDDQEFHLDEKSWYVAACSAPDPYDALSWAQDQMDAGNTTLSIRSFKSYIKTQQTSEKSVRARNRKNAMYDLHHSGLIDKVNDFICRPQGLEIKVAFADIEKKMPVQLYLKEVDPTSIPRVFEGDVRNDFLEIADWIEHQKDKRVDGDDA